MAKSKRSDNATTTTSATAGPKLSRRTIQTIVDRVLLNRVTIVIGPTGCGKSTLVPACIKAELGGPILCTQPRRLAVVAVATRVAETMSGSVPLGGDEVGYHVGQTNLSVRDTKLLFCTAGILLEELRANGKAVLEKHECLLIDECHERSTESDLCLSVIRQLMCSYPSLDVRIILMSATFDHSRYKHYFKGVPGCDTIDTITLETAESFDSFYSRVETLYLDDFVKKLPAGSQQHAELLQVMKRNPDTDLRGPDTDNGRSLSFHLLLLIAKLTAWLDGEESPEAPFLVFAPTYRHLEQIHQFLQRNWEGTKALALSVLHSSVDIEECIRSIQSSSSRSGGKSQPRRILLASAIADSSITIPGVTCVIDTCRSLEVSWDGEKHSSRTVWASRSICDQRQGRTGRTCAGRVFRLLPKNYFLSALQEFETPQITLSDCRNEAMALLSSSTNDISDRLSLLAKSMDPPPPHVVTQATSFLKDIGACMETGGQRSKIVATEYGTLLATMPFSIADSRLILRAAQHGYLHEMLLLRSIKMIRPSPIVTYFADEHSSQSALQKYKRDVERKEHMDVAFAHMSSYMFWDSTWNEARRLDAYKSFHECTQGASPSPPGSSVTESNSVPTSKSPETRARRLDCGVWQMNEEIEEAHALFCRSHELNPTSVKAIADTMEITLDILFQAKFEPDWLRCCPVGPLWQRREDWIVSPSEGAPFQMLPTIFGHRYEETLRGKLDMFLNAGIYGTDLLEEPILDQNTPVVPHQEACVHFLSGNCSYGSRCRNAHSFFAKRPMCKYFQLGQCNKGKNCIYSHETGQKSKGKKQKNGTMKSDPLKSMVPVIRSMSLDGGAKEWFVEHSQNLLLFGELNFRFTKALASLGEPPRIATEFVKVDTNRLNRISPHSYFVDEVDATRVHTNHNLSIAIEKEIKGFAWNFPYTGSEENDEANQDLLLGSFLSVALFAMRINLPHPYFGLTLQGDQLSRWNVLRSAQRTGWRLRGWANFNHKDFPGYEPSRANGDSFPYEHGRLYVFVLDDEATGLIM